MLCCGFKLFDLVCSELMQLCKDLVVMVCVKYIVCVLSWIKELDMVYSFPLLAMGTLIVFFFCFHEAVHAFLHSQDPTEEFNVNLILQWIFMLWSAYVILVHFCVPFVSVKLFFDAKRGVHLDENIELYSEDFPVVRLEMLMLPC